MRTSCRESSPVERIHQIIKRCLRNVRGSFSNSLAAVGIITFFQKSICGFPPVRRDFSARPQCRWTRTTLLLCTPFVLLEGRIPKALLRPSLCFLCPPNDASDGTDVSFHPPVGLPD